MHLLRDRLASGAAIAATAFLVGCATHAEQHLAAVIWGLKANSVEANTCASTVNIDPRFDPLWIHKPQMPVSPTSDQLSDTTYALPNDVILLAQHHAAMAPCREAALVRLSAVDMRFANTFAEFYNREDELALSVAEQKVTWGQANSNTRQLGLAFIEQMRGVGGQIDQETAEQKTVELVNRAEVAAEIGHDFIVAAQVVGAAVELAAQIHSAQLQSRPVVTTCNQMLFNTTCVSH